MFFPAISTHADERESDVIVYGYSSLEHAILNSINLSSAPNDASGLLILLGEIDTKNGRKLLTKLTNYYLGSSTSEALTYSIVKQGDKILPNLRKEIDKDNACIELHGDKDNKCLSIEERNKTILRYIELIESGVKIEYAL